MSIKYIIEILRCMKSGDLQRFIQYGDLPTSYFVKKGMKIGKRFTRESGCRLDPSNCWLIEIGDDVIMSNKCQLLAHDFSMVFHTGYARFGRIVIGNRVFIGANSTILMNVRIGNDVIIGAGSLVNKDIPDGCVVAGVPAKVICSTEDFIKKQELLISRCPQTNMTEMPYGRGRISDERKDKLLHAINSSVYRIFYLQCNKFKRRIKDGEIITICNN